MLYQETLDHQNRKKNCCSLLKYTLCALGFHGAWMFPICKFCRHIELLECYFLGDDLQILLK